MEFYAVTKTSVYSVTDKRDENGWPIVEKIALRKESFIPIGGRLENGRLVGVTSIGILLYDEDHPRPGRRQLPEMVNIAFYGGKTSPIIALFLEKDEAMACSNSENLEISDLRWRGQTEEVLNMIGNDHEVFVISIFDHPLDKPRDLYNPEKRKEE